MNNNNIDQAIAMMIMAQKKFQAERDAAAAVKAPKAPKAPKEPKVASPPARPVEPRPVMPLTVPLEAAHAFVAACRSAGRRGFRVDDTQVIPDQILAIKALTGVYYAPHGACLDAARRLAMTAINRAAGISTAPRRPTATVAGYVAGMPDALGKAEADQRARDLLAARLELRLEVARNPEQVRAALEDAAMI
jgi:hypothetical protein